MLHVVLVDAATGLVRALRVLTLPPDLPMRLFAALADQLQRPWHGREAHDRELASICRRFPTSKALLETAITRGRGGS